MNILPLSEKIKPKWDYLLHSSDDGWVFSSSDWIEMVCSVWNMEDKSFAIEENGTLIAAVPLQWISSVNRLASGGWGHGGVFISRNVSPTDRIRLWKAAWSNVENLAIELGAKKITASISPVCMSSLNNHWGVNPLVTSGYIDSSTHALIVNLTNSEDLLWKNLSKDARQKIKQAQEAGYSVKKVEWAKTVDEYYSIHQETYYRTGVTPLPIDYFSGISKLNSSNFVLWGGYDKNGVAVAFHNNARFGKSGMYHTGCSKSEHLNSGINYLLFWEAICSAKQDGLLWYEAGEAFPQAKTGKDKGLTGFKEKFGGELHRSFRGELILPEPQIPTATDIQKTEAISLRSLLRDWLKLSKQLLIKIFKKMFTKNLSS